MIKTEFIEVWGFRHAIRGMRNSYESWDKSDSYETHIENPETLNTAPFEFFIGDEDLKLMRKLFREGASPRKFLRQIFVSMDITAPLYWWKQYATYKVGTTENSESTMHSIMKRPLTLDDFSFERANKVLNPEALPEILCKLNNVRALYKEMQYGDPEAIAIAEEEGITMEDLFYTTIQMLPDGYMQRRTVTFTYENAANMLEWREFHRLDEWKAFCKVLKSLPYMEDIRNIIPREGNRSGAAED